MAATSSSSWTTARDVPIFITSTAVSSERRINPSWSITQLKAKLETVTGISPASQTLTLCLPNQHQETPLQAEDEDSTTIGQWPLVAYAEIKVKSSYDTTSDNMPSRNVSKYFMPDSVYEKRPATVLAYKKAHQIGRFNPFAETYLEIRVQDMWREVLDRNIDIGARCHLLNETHRRGEVAFIGCIDDLPGPTGGPWIGIRLDEPTGKNDGSIKGQRYFECEPNRGVVVRPSFLVIGDFVPLDEDIYEEF